MFKRILIGLLLVMVVVVVIGGGLIAADAFGGAQSTDVTNVVYPAQDGTELYGYLAVPEGADGEKYPAVLMVHEWWGLTAEITKMADTLAEEGYVVLAPDTYRGRVATTVPAAITLRVTVPEERVDSDMQAAYEYLIALPEVDRLRVGVIGFCYGGGVALRHAVQNPQIAATVNLYGDTIDNPQEFGALLESGKPLLGIFGEDDQQIPVSEVEAFDAALDEAGIPNEVTIYPGVGHAFVNPETILEVGAAQDAWTQIIAFFDEHLKAS
jgi:carboxymethylenebutenolidase